MRLRELRTRFIQKNGVETQSEVLQNIKHLMYDVGWFGVLNGSILAFLAVYATRVGASGLQIGLINAVPAVVNLIIALPAGSWLDSKPVHKPLFLSAMFTRFFYLLLIPLPSLLPGTYQIWTIILLTFAMNIPGTILAVSFNVMFANSVPIDKRWRVVGIRNAVFAIVTVITTLICGQILNVVVFPVGYQLVFTIGSIGAILSTYHLWRLRLNEPQTDHVTRTPKTDILLKKFPSTFFRLNALTGSYPKVLGMLFGFHLFQYLAIPIFPIFQVNILNLSDSLLGLGNGLFYITVFLGSTQLARLSSKHGNQRVTGLGAILLALYPAILALGQSGTTYLIASVVGGLAWAWVGGALFNYMLENAPEKDRSGSMAWYHLVLNAAILMGSLGGPVIANLTGIQPALLLFALGRLIIGLVIFIWG